MVYIKKITTKGFKSYGNRTVSVTLSKDFTCIVGPNGSGKSNIIDAVSFVLGRLSTKSMRAVVLSDLIFAGSKKMNPARYAEVSLYLDNSNDELPFERKEVIISRSVDTSGKSVYRINRKRETRTYVLDVLSQVGIFPEGHNIVMQGDITRFIKMSSWERRGVIEEISGIAEYNERRERGDRELEKAEENIARVELVLNEVEKQMIRLEAEKSDALRYQFLKDEIYKGKGWLYKGELNEAQQKLKKTEEAITRNKKDAAESSQKISEIVLSISQKEENFDLINSEIEKLGEEKHVSITREIERLRGELRTIEEGLRFLHEQRTQLLARKDTYLKTQQENTAQIKNESEKITLLKQKKDELTQKISELKQEYQKHVSVLSEIGLENLERISKELDEKKDAFFSLEAQEDILINTIQTLAHTRTELEETLASLAQEKEGVTRELNGLKEDYTAVQERLSRTTAEYDSLFQQRKELKTDLSDIDSELLTKRSESIKLHSKLQAFKEDQRASPYKAVNTILEAKDTLQGVYGTISQLGKTDARYQTALEVAAGNRIHNIVVDSTDTAKRCITYLKQIKAGRATFLPLDRMQGRSLPTVKEKGVIDYAINLVSFDPMFRPAFEDVFSDTLVVEDLDIDLKGKRLVTLEGDVFERGGAITGGHYFKRKYSSAFLISEDQSQFKKVQEELNALKQRRTDVAETLSSIEPELQRMYDEKLKLEERVPVLEKELTRITEEVHDVEKEIDGTKERIDASSRQLDAKKEELSTITKRKSSLEGELNSLEQEKEEIARPLRQDELERIEKELESARNQLSETESEKVQAESVLKYLGEDNERLEKTIQELLPQIDGKEHDITSKKKEKEDLDRELAERVHDEETFDEKIRKLRDDRTRIRDEIGALRQQKERHQKRAYECESALNLLGSQKTQLGTTIDELRDLSSQYPVEGVYEDLKELRFKIKQMETEKERLEPINMRAVEEFEEVQLRYMELKTRIDKLYKEKESILEFIAEVESQKKTVFFEAFYNVAENFSRIFGELSPGGSGSLVLENDEEPFDGGLDIEASPKGKELKRVEAMSGGEKALTALAFVFAVQQYKPAPFYVFDEIDAHLDDENATRVAELIKKSSKGTQFIVITLRDVMMAAADILYGVSMKDNISKIVSVELEKIAEYKETLEPETVVI
ncbi:MAG: chromosome segregation protein SMC [Theionarchaea archaeon]|nr:chromosome segregation protein SMC [Theionarchaea archaeon]